MGGGSGGRRDAERSLRGLRQQGLLGQPAVRALPLPWSLPSPTGSCARPPGPPKPLVVAWIRRCWSSWDEAANICRISDLPELYSHLGSRGITPITILQSYDAATFCRRMGRCPWSKNLRRWVVDGCRCSVVACLCLWFAVEDSTDRFRQEGVLSDLASIRRRFDLGLPGLRNPKWPGRILSALSCHLLYY